MKRFLLFVLLCFAAGLVHAGCVEGVQKPLTAKEKIYYTKFKTLRAAVPPPAAGWQYSADSHDVLAPGYDATPPYTCGPDNYFIGLNVSYGRPMSEAEAQQEIKIMQAPPDPAKQKQVDALMAKRQALIQQLMAAAQKQDAKSLDAIGKQNDALGKRIQVAQVQATASKKAALDKLQYDRKATLSIDINDVTSADCYGSPKPLQVADAVAYSCEAPATYSSPGDQQDPVHGSIVVVYGKSTTDTVDWERQDDQGAEHKDSAVILRTEVQQGTDPKVQNLVIRIVGDDLARAQAIYKQLDLKPLAALVKP
ncbi:MAG TPA: hypothetical protein VGH91_05015 [Gammaproteobacteria bacterium]|jgi:hypothetical protein